MRGTRETRAGSSITHRKSGETLGSHRTAKGHHVMRLHPMMTTTLTTVTPTDTLKAPPTYSLHYRTN